MKRLVTTAVILLVLGAAVWAIRRPKPAVDVTTVRVENGDVRIVLNSASAGEVMPVQRAMVRGEMAGTVTVVHCARGERVEEGQAVLTLDARDARARVSQAQAAVDVAAVSVETAKVRMAGTKQQRDRMEKLVKAGSGAAAELERMDTELAAAQAGVQAAEAQVRQARAAVTVARLALDRTTLRAPFAGVLQDVMVTPGSQVTPGVPVFDLVDDSHLYVAAPMDEVDAPRVQPGQAVVLTFDSVHSREVAGLVRLVAPALARDERLSRTLRIEIDMTDPPPLRVGMAANVAVVERVVHGVKVVPSISVLGRGLERTVLVVEDIGADGAGTIRKRTIRTGSYNDDLTEVVEGLTATDLVVYAPNDPGVKEGARAHGVMLNRPVTTPAPLAGLQEGQSPQVVKPDEAKAP